MGIARLFNAFRARRRGAAHRSPARGRVRLRQAFGAEPLERRAMLAVSTVFVDDTWVMVDDADASSTVSLYDLVNDGISGDGYVAAEYGVNAFGAVSSGPPTGSDADYDTIAEAIAATASGGETRVLAFANSAAVSVTTPVKLSGVFTIGTGDLTLDHADAVLAPGAGSSGGGTGMIYVDDGNLLLDAGTLYVKISNGNAASKVKVDGTVSIDPSVELRIATGSTATGSQTYTIIENDGGDAITGTFAGLGQGATVHAGHRRYTISYTGGTGNDVVLTLVGSEAFTTYVSDDWDDLGGGDVEYETDDGTIQTKLEAQTSPNLNGFTTSGWENIADAVAAVAERGSVQVLHSPSGGYSGAVTIDKSLVLQGPFELDAALTVQSGVGATIVTSRHGGTIRVNELALSGKTTLSMLVNPHGTSDRIEIEDAVDLGGAALELMSLPIFEETPADILLVDNESGNAVSGTFAGLPEGARLVLEGQQYWITYSGGDGNDVELIVPSSTVFGRHIFYNNSYYDGNDTAINSDDDDAIDPSKTAYKPGDDPTTFAHITGYSKGINGIMIDLAGNGDHGSITANDFFFTVGNNNSPHSWSTAPAPSAVSIRSGAGVSGSDRVEITWADGDIQKQWLAVHVLSTINTGLTTPDVFYWGNAVGGSGDGDTSTAAPTNVTDELGAQNNPHGFGNYALVDDAYDYNKDRNVNASDVLIARNNATGFGTQLRKIALEQGPELPRLTGPTSGTPGQEVTFSVSAPLLEDGTLDTSVEGVDFYEDVNGNGVLDAADVLLAEGDEVLNDDDQVIGWTGSFDPQELSALGRRGIFAVPILPDDQPSRRPPVTFSTTFVPPPPPFNPAVWLEEINPIGAPNINASTSILGDWGAWPEEYWLTTSNNATRPALTARAGDYGGYIGSNSAPPGYGGGYTGATAVTWAGAGTPGGSSNVQIMASADASVAAQFVDTGYVRSIAGAFTNGTVNFFVAANDLPIGTPVTLRLDLMAMRSALVTGDELGISNFSSSGFNVDIYTLNGITVSGTVAKYGDTEDIFGIDSAFGALSTVTVVPARVGDRFRVIYNAGTATDIQQQYPDETQGAGSAHSQIAFVAQVQWGG